MLAALAHGLRAELGTVVIERQDGNWWAGCGIGI